jgi:tether containing UBX domain for GLUT4
VHVFTRQAEAERDAAQLAAAAPPLDESAYDVTEGDLRRVMAGYAARRNQEERGLMTRQMREAQEAARAAACGPVAVRLELPDGHVLQATFAATAPLEELRAVALRALAPAAGASCHLFTAPPKVVLRDMAATFYAARLAPAARVHVGFAGDVEGGPLLRPEVAELLGEPPARAESLQRPSVGNGEGGSVAPDAGGAARQAGPAAEPARQAGGDQRRAVGGSAPGAGPKWLKLGGK